MARLRASAGPSMSPGYTIIPFLHWATLFPRKLPERERYHLLEQSTSGPGRVSVSDCCTNRRLLFNLGFFVYCLFIFLTKMLNESLSHLAI